MKIDRAYLPVETLGPGKRLVVWTRGCSKHCKGCANPELWSIKGGRDIASEKLAAMLQEMASRANIDRITFTGGDPLEQPDALMHVLRKLRSHFRDILVYTGYTLDEARQALGTVRFKELTQLVDALIDGRYIAALNDGECALRGSTNQKLWLFDQELHLDYEAALAQPRSVQNVVFDGRSMSIGIHAAEQA